MLSRASQANLSRAIGEWWNEHAARNGFSSTLGRFMALFWEFLRESTPSRRRQRYGDVDYDWDFRVDTTSATVGWRERLLGALHSPYQATEPRLFHEMLSHLKIDFRDFIFVDLGSGKGRTLLMAADYPFRRIVGVELLAALNNIAQENIGRFKSKSQKCFAIESAWGDAREFVFPAEPIVLYLFNPLPEVGLERVITNLERSLRENPRPVHLLYHSPLLEHVVARCGELKKLEGTDRYSIYVSTL